MTRNEGGSGSSQGAKATVVALALLVAGLAEARADDAHPFARYMGAWQGAGRIEMAKGELRDLTCTATCDESEGGKALAQSILCHSKTHDYDIETYLVAKGADVVGNWREIEMQVSGQVTGHIEGTLFTGKVNAPGVDASVWMRADQRLQALKIEPHGADVANFEIVLKREP